METLRGVVEVAIGVVYGIGAVFNTACTLRHGAEFYGAFAERAWFPPGRWLIRRIVIPNGTAVTVLVILFQVGVAVAILSRGDLVAPALYAGGIFALVVAFFSSPGGAVGNVALAVLQFGLAVTR